MIIPLKKKLTTIFVHPKRAGQTDNGTRTKPRRKKGGEPDKFFCPCGGSIKMVKLFCNGLNLRAVCQKCGKKQRRPNEF